MIATRYDHNQDHWRFKRQSYEAQRGEPIEWEHRRGPALKCWWHLAAIGLTAIATIVVAII